VTPSRGQSTAVEGVWYGGMSIDPGAARSGQISDKYQYYGHAYFSDDAAPGASMAGSNSRKPVVGMKIRVALVSALLLGFVNAIVRPIMVLLPFRLEH